MSSSASSASISSSPMSSGSNPALLTTFTSKLSAMLAMKDLGPLHYFLGIEVFRTSSGLLLSQTRYTSDLLTKFDMQDAKSVLTPIAAKPQPSLHDGDLLDDPSEYRSMVGGLQYLTLTRPDIAYAVNIVSQFMHCPRSSHLQAVKRIFRFLKGTIDHGLLLRPSTDFNITAYFDADWAGCPDTRRSTTGYAILLGSNVVSWSAKKQPTVSRSSAESEYRPIAFATAETYWLRYILRDLDVHLSAPVRVLCDNVSATYLAANPVFHARTKHIEIDFHLVREKVASGELLVRYVSSSD